MIPRVLWQSWKTTDIPALVRSQQQSWVENNPDLRFEFHDDAECDKFIQEHFDSEIYDLYITLPLPIMRADFWRVAVIYIHGGIYADLDITCNVDIKTIVNFDASAVWMKELDNVANFFFAAEPKHPALRLALDYMIDTGKSIGTVDAQDFGMHSLHQAVRDFYSVVGTDYPANNQVQFLNNEQLKAQGKLIHIGASGPDFVGRGYDSWRAQVHLMNAEREQTEDILFFTTFNKNGYDLYGNQWIRTFIAVANYYNRFRAKIYYEGFKPTIQHPSIEWVRYEDAVPQHKKWKKSYLDKTTHADYVKSMTVRFSHKAFVIQHALDTNTNRYLIWLDGDCVFKNADYTGFPKNLLNDQALACQVEQNHELNHVESGILIFDTQHPDTETFNQHFKKNYQISKVLKMGQPYDGFIVFKSLLTSGIDYVDLNADIGGGIQSDPTMTFLHPEIQSKFIHNIGWTGKGQYAEWNIVLGRDDIYQKMKTVLFGECRSELMQKQKEQARLKLSKLKQIKNIALSRT